MLTLGINTSGPACDVAVLEDGICLAARHEGMVRGQDARLPGTISASLDAAGKSAGDLSRIGVVTGPGSFTGIPAGQQGSALVALPAKRRPPELSYWVQRFRTGIATGAPEEIDLDVLADELKAHPHFIFGETAGALAERLEGMETHPASPTALRAAEIAEGAGEDSAAASPVYVRAPDAALPGGRKP